MVLEAERRSCDVVEDGTGLFLTPEPTSMRQSTADMRRLGFRGHSRMTRPELVDIIESNRRHPPMTLNDLSMGRLRDSVRARDVEFNSKTRKSEHFQMLNGNINVQAVRIVTKFMNDIVHKFYADVETYKSVDVDCLWGEAKEAAMGVIRQRIGQGKEVRMSVEAEFVKMDGTSIMFRF